MSTLSRTPYGYWGDCCLDFKTTLDLSIDSHNAGNLLFISDMFASCLSTVHSCHKFIVPKGLLMNSDLLVYSWFTQASFKPWDPKQDNITQTVPWTGGPSSHAMNAKFWPYHLIPQPKLRFRPRFSSFQLSNSDWPVHPQVLVLGWPREEYSQFN